MGWARFVARPGRPAPVRRTIGRDTKRRDASADALARRRQLTHGDASRASRISARGQCALPPAPVRTQPRPRSPCSRTRMEPPRPRTPRLPMHISSTRPCAPDAGWPGSVLGCAALLPSRASHKPCQLAPRDARIFPTETRGRQERFGPANRLRCGQNFAEIDELCDHPRGSGAPRALSRAARPCVALVTTARRKPPAGAASALRRQDDGRPRPGRIAALAPGIRRQL